MSKPISDLAELSVNWWTQEDADHVLHTLKVLMREKQRLLKDLDDLRREYARFRRANEAAAHVCHP